MPTKWNAMTELTTKVTGTYKDPLSRQVAEAVLIMRSTGSTYEILNSKAEFRQPPIVGVRRENIKKSTFL